MTKKVVKKRKPTSPPYPEYPDWSTSFFWSYVRGILRRAHTRWPPKIAVVKSATRPYVGANTRQRVEVLCAMCSEWHKKDNVEADHIVPCGSLRSPADLPGFVTRLFVSQDKYRVLCKPCHKAHTKTEREKVKANEEN